MKNYTDVFMNIIMSVKYKCIDVDTVNSHIFLHYKFCLDTTCHFSPGRRANIGDLGHTNAFILVL